MQGWKLNPDTLTLQMQFNWLCHDKHPPVCILTYLPHCPSIKTINMLGLKSSCSLFHYLKYGSCQVMCVYISHLCLWEEPPTKPHLFVNLQFLESAPQTSCNESPLPNLINCSDPRLLHYINNHAPFPVLLLQKHFPSVFAVFVR